ncbi:hypothetical protein [Demequina sp. NBRC 110057]|uniref:hypothetical protein n=1 Tax=Demequina sp. NBRC 110057 TaxID=1570346 RepID=UPI0011773ECE|nr:hypothetical protein [Demequina sp. NBRC 110057]
MALEYRIGCVLLAAVACALGLAGCAGYSSTPQSGVNDADQARSNTVSCSQLLESAVALSRSDLSSNQLNNEVAALSEQCSREYGVFTDYVSSVASTEAAGVTTCRSWTQYIVDDAIALLREDGLCTDGDGSGEVAASWPDGGLGWDEASDHVGTTQRVCGPLRSLRNTEDGAFLNLGVDYPSPERFTFIIWGYYVDPIEVGLTVCGSGSIYLYDGVTQIELSSPETIEIWQ